MAYIGVQPPTQKGGRVLIKSMEASGESAINFVDGADGVVFDTTYDSYEWHWVSIHPSSNGVTFMFQVNATDDAGGGFDTSTITSTYWRAKHHEDDSASGLDYIDAYDLANSTDFQILPNETGNEDDESTSGVLKIFNAGSTVLSKNFIARASNAHHSNISMDNFVAGYINDTTAIDEISFKFTSGTVDGGEMYMYGVKNA